MIMAIDLHNNYTGKVHTSVHPLYVGSGDGGLEGLRQGDATTTSGENTGLRGGGSGTDATLAELDAAPKHSWSPVVFPWRAGNTTEVAGDSISLSSTPLSLSTFCIYTQEHHTSVAYLIGPRTSVGTGILCLTSSSSNFNCSHPIFSLKLSFSSFMHRASLSQVFSSLLSFSTSSLVA